jgi:hypothetical protein
LLRAASRRSGVNDPWAELDRAFQPAPRTCRKIILRMSARGRAGCREAAPLRLSNRSRTAGIGTGPFLSTRGAHPTDNTLRLSHMPSLLAANPAIERYRKQGKPTQRRKD